jgi:hypothetical protein
MGADKNFFEETPAKSQYQLQGLPHELAKVM